MSSPLPGLDRLRNQYAAIERLNPRYHAYSHLAEWDERAVGERLASEPPGLLSGLGVSVKGNIPVAGLPYTEGSAIFADRIATRDAAIVSRVRRAGGHIHGLTTLSELAMYGVRNPFETMGLNPWNEARTAGGSSTGAGVAAALGMGDLHIGTDAGGSIRNPACHNGVVGFMPRIGGLTRDGKANHSPSLSSVGLIAANMDMLLRGYRALSDDRLDGKPARRLVVPYRFVETMCDDASYAIFTAALSALERAGFTLVNHEFTGWMAAERAAGIASMYEGGQALVRMDLTKAGEGIRRRAEAASRLDAEEVAEAYRLRDAFRMELAEVMAETDADAVATPTWPFAAAELDATEVPVHGRMVPLDPHRNCFVRVGNAIDACAITLPGGFYEVERVPAGFHLMASGGTEARLLALAAAVEPLLPKIPALRL